MPALTADKSGVSIKVISERLGQESQAFTLKRYAYVIPGKPAEAAAQVAAMVDGSTGDSGVAGAEFEPATFGL